MLRYEASAIAEMEERKDASLTGIVKRKERKEGLGHEPNQLSENKSCGKTRDFEGRSKEESANEGGADHVRYRDLMGEEEAPTAESSSSKPICCKVIFAL